ncbi:glycoside hydrolase family 19 protein [Pseudomonas tohonis]|uniref:glycoside hydrolase family 19 protein n=1 Tax=Pseudomonas tohonis TaxID=2725477 RepID=UPI001F1A1FFE|nr:glycoside hydrolase family 19 protein [Pseudomonas tohonis]
MDLESLVSIFPNARSQAGVFVSAINRAVARFDITSPVRLAAFLAQVGHESGGLTRLVENLNYSAQGLANTWPARFKDANGQPSALANQIARKPELIANAVYGGRLGNGPVASGDGWRYRGRGLIQLTGKANYKASGEALGVDLVAHPELLEQPEWACLAAAWFWKEHGLNELADAGKFEAITKRINGGLTGQAERIALRERAKAVLA